MLLRMMKIFRGPLAALAAAIMLSSLLSAQEAAAPQQTPAAQSSPTPAAVQPLSTADESASRVERLPPTNDPKEIVRRPTEVDHHNFERAQKYTCTQRQVIKHLDKHGNVKSTEIKTFDINFYFGEFYARLVQQDDKPLSEKEQKKEDEKLEKFLSKRRNESEEDRRKRTDKQRKEREE